MKNTCIFIVLIVLVLTMLSCSSGKGYGCDYSSNDQEIKDTRKSNTTYIKKEITTINCAT